MDTQLAANTASLKLTGKQTGDRKSAFTKPVDAFESKFFSNLVVILEGVFVHRSRTIEKKDGNVLNKVRRLRNSIIEHGGMMTAAKSIKYDPKKPVLKVEIGDKINISKAEFKRLFQAFFAEIEFRIV